MNPADYWVEKYGLQPHPEGGFYTETYRSAEIIPRSALPARFSGDRSVSTGIYFLLEKGNFSAFHKIHSDEMWHFYAGDPLDVYIVQPLDGTMKVIRLGNDPEQGQMFQAVVPAGVWFASRPAAGGQYAFVGCTVAPGFDFADFEMADRETMQAQFPEHAGLIQELTRV